LIYLFVPFVRDLLEVKGASKLGGGPSGRRVVESDVDFTKGKGACKEELLLWG